MAGVLLVALLYALGRYTPLYALAFSYVPGISLFRRPIDGAFVLVAALALLAGQLLADYVREGVPRVARWRLVAVAACALGVVAWAVLFSGKSHRGWSSLWEALKVVPLALLVIGLLARARGPPGADGRGGVRGGRWRPPSSSGAAPPRASTPRLPATTRCCRARPAPMRRRSPSSRPSSRPGTSTGEWPRVEIVGVSGSWQNLAMARGLEATNGYNPLRIGSYDRLVSPGETTHIVDQRLFPASFDGYDCALARELGLEYVVLGRPIEEVPHLRAPAGRRGAAGGPEGVDLPAAAAPSRASSSSSA